MVDCSKCGQQLDEQDTECSNCGQSCSAALTNKEDTPSAQTSPPNLATPTSNPHYIQPEKIPNKQKINGFAIASLVCGILAITGLFGIIFAIIALGQIGAGFGPTRGRGLAIAGLVISIFWPIFLISPSYLPHGKAHEKEQQSVCLINQKQLALAVNMYAQENKEQFPANAADWDKDIGLRGLKQCTARPPGKTPHTAMP